MSTVTSPPAVWTRPLGRLLVIPMLLFCFASEAGAQEDGSEPALLDPFGDFRLRLEQDWDSRSGDGTKLDDLQVGYYYSHIEALAAHSSYIQDDWARWGTSTQARLTNMKGSEFRVLFTISPRQNIFARLFIVDAIDLLQPGDLALEDGKRFRIEYNVSF